MPICPVCNKEYTRRKNECCPGCATPILLYEGKWYCAKEGMPYIILLHLWEKLLGKQSGCPTFHIPKKSSRYKVEITHAINLLNDANGNIDLAKEALRVSFNHPDFAWKSYPSMISLYTGWILALSKARIQIRARQQCEQAQQKAYKQMMQRENIFTNEHKNKKAL